MPETAFGRSEQYKQMVNDFNVFYGNVMSEVKANVDEFQVGVKSVSFETATKPGKSMKDSKNLNEIVIQWQLINDSGKYDDTNSEHKICSEVNECRWSARIKYVMALYREYFLSKYVYNENDGSMEFVDIFCNALVDYTEIELLNDLQHVQKYNLNDKHGYKQYIGYFRIFINIHLFGGHTLFRR